MDSAAEHDEKALASRPDQSPDAGSGHTPKGGSRAGRARWMRLAGDLLLIVGGLVLAYPFWSAAYAQVQQSRLDSAYRTQSVAFVDSITANADTRPQRGVSDQELVRRLAVRYVAGLKSGDPIGRLRIPRIGLDRLVQQGVGGRLALDPNGDAALLRNGPVHYAITPLPGAGEPFAVAGHRTTYGAPFNKLDRLRKGDAIFVDTPYAKLRYAVARTTTVLPSDVGVLRDRGFALVLTTCTPLYSASHRLVVWATLEKAQPLRAARGL
jgi:sortase A